MIVDTPSKPSPGVASVRTSVEFRDTVDGGAVRVLLTLVEDVGRDGGEEDGVGGARSEHVGGSSAVRTSLAWPDAIPLPARLTVIAARLFTLRQRASVASSTVAVKTPSATFKRLQRLGRSIDALAAEHRATEPTATADDMRWIARLRLGLRSRKKTAVQQPAQQAAAELAAPSEEQPRAPAVEAGPSTRTVEATPSPPTKGPRIAAQADHTRWLPELNRS